MSSFVKPNSLAKLVHHGPKTLWIVLYLIIIASFQEQVTSRELGRKLSFGIRPGHQQKYNLGFARELSSPSTPAQHLTQPPHPLGAHRKQATGSLCFFRSYLRRERSGNALQNLCFVLLITYLKNVRLVLIDILLICAL